MLDYCQSWSNLPSSFKNPLISILNVSSSSFSIKKIIKSKHFQSLPFEWKFWRIELANIIINPNFAWIMITMSTWNMFLYTAKALQVFCQPDTQGHEFRCKVISLHCNCQCTLLQKCAIKSSVKNLSNKISQKETVRNCKRSSSAAQNTVKKKEIWDYFIVLEKRAHEALFEIKVSIKFL